MCTLFLCGCMGPYSHPRISHLLMAKAMTYSCRYVVKQTGYNLTMKAQSYIIATERTDPILITYIPLNSTDLTLNSSSSKST